MAVLVMDDGSYSERDYLAPTVYKKKGLTITGGWNYYTTFQQAQQKWMYLNNIPGGANVAPAGSVSFDTSEAQTMGINVDFYYYIFAYQKFVPTTYKFLRGVTYKPPVIFRFYTREGLGPYYAIFDWNSLAMSATAISSVEPAKLAALDDLYRETALLKYRYNNLAGFLNGLAVKQLTAKEQQIYNEGVLRLQNMQGQILSLPGIELQFTDKGTLGLPILLIIAVIIILAAATAYTITTIVQMKERTKQINDSYNLSQWVANKKQEIAQQVQSGAISQEEASSIYKTLDEATSTANKVANNASKAGSGGLLSDITNVIKWAVGGYVIYEGIQLIKKPKATV
jgi:hypothetical protein